MCVHFMTDHVSYISFAADQYGKILFSMESSIHNIYMQHCDNSNDLVV
jgi:hypothetical protein